MTPYYMEPYKEDPMRKRMDEYGTIVKKLAEKYNLPFVDLQEGCMYIAKQFRKTIGAERC